MIKQVGLTTHCHVIFREGRGWKKTRIVYQREPSCSQRLRWVTHNPQGFLWDNVKYINLLLCVVGDWWHTVMNNWLRVSSGLFCTVNHFISCQSDTINNTVCIVYFKPSCKGVSVWRWKNSQVSAFVVVLQTSFNASRADHLLFPYRHPIFALYHPVVPPFQRAFQIKRSTSQNKYQILIKVINLWTWYPKRCQICRRLSPLLSAISIDSLVRPDDDNPLSFDGWHNLV